MYDIPVPHVATENIFSGNFSTNLMASNASKRDIFGGGVAGLGLVCCVPQYRVQRLIANLEDSRTMTGEC